MKEIIIIFYLIFYSLITYAVDINQGIVLSKKANIYETPNKSSKIINNLMKDDIFIIKKINILNNNDKNDYFLEIEKDNKILGWIYKQDVGINIFSDKLGLDISSLKLKKYIKMINDNNVELWLVMTSYYFDQYFYGMVITTKKDSKLIKQLDDNIDIKIFEYKDINSDGTNEIIIENNWHGFTDPTNGSTLDIYGIFDG